MKLGRDEVRGKRFDQDVIIPDHRIVVPSRILNIIFQFLELRLKLQKVGICLQLRVCLCDRKEAL